MVKKLPTKILQTVSPSVSALPVFPVVGIGASAGGLAAFEAFFTGFPKDIDPDMAFVLVQHLAPDHKSILSELIRRYTHMPVFEVEEGMPIQINCVYITPPNCDMAYHEGSLQLLEPVAPRGQRLPIDFFFCSLARELQERAIGIVLSGTGHDGAQGVHAIKDSAGMVIAQSPESAEFDGMPLSAIATGLVDLVMGPAEMLPRLMANVADTPDRWMRPTRVTPLHPDGVLEKIYSLLLSQTGHDFFGYKSGTIHRRIEHRMELLSIKSIDSYFKHMQQSNTEVDALFRDLLIGVTHFFRDPEAFAVLQRQVIPALFIDRKSNASIRIWVAGCSTGEEAYSLAILLQEHMQTLKQSYSVQVFASDIDSKAIATARAGCYPASIAADVSPERLGRFFSAEPGGKIFRVNKVIRDMLVFSEQDLVKDPPFSKMDFISCRNLLIYLGGNLQKKVIHVFHYALRAGGTLFLGSSEGVSSFTELFTVLDGKAKLYQRKNNFLSAQRPKLSHTTPNAQAMGVALPRSADQVDAPSPLPLRELVERALLKLLAPIAALTDERGDILYLHGRAGMFLEPSAGESGVNNILKMAREGLRPALSTALHDAKITKLTVYINHVRVKTNGHHSWVNLTVSQVTNLLDASLESPLFLVCMEVATELTDQAVLPAPQQAPDGSSTSPSQNHEAHMATLHQELRAKDEFLQSAYEELESSREELKSSNEELSTVNSELQVKLADLSRTNGDMNNLLAGTGIGTVFVDFELRILRFTPAASSIMNLIMADMGRPVAHIASNLVHYDTLVGDVRSVLDTLIPKALDVQTRDGKWYTLRIQPYRTLDNVIEGAVISFIEITERMQMQEALRVANNQLRLAVVVRDASDAITVQDLLGRITAWNPGAVRLYGWSESQALQMNVRDRIPPEQRDREIDKLTQLSRAEVLQPYLTQRLTCSGGVLEVSVVATGLLNETGQLYAIATTERGITTRPAV